MHFVLLFKMTHRCIEYRCYQYIIGPLGYHRHHHHHRRHRIIVVDLHATRIFIYFLISPS